MPEESALDLWIAYNDSCNVGDHDRAATYSPTN
jgi:hypothetical protein